MARRCPPPDDAGSGRARDRPARGSTPPRARGAGLLVTGSSTAEIAAAPVVSVRTVDHHGSAVPATPGMPTRGAGLGEAIRRGLVGRLSDAHRAVSGAG